MLSMRTHGDTKGVLNGLSAYIAGVAGRGNWDNTDAMKDKTNSNTNM